ncbi:MAG: Holliday junction resolvase RuvX [Gemmatimonadetes bacterium]|nr:Holliday junction resolvase RuvX [Gemmatimonadota bacterium]
MAPPTAPHPGATRPSARFLGIDFGERRVGVAVSDPTGRLASPLTTLVRRAGKRPPLADLERIAREQEAAGLVLGLPLDLDGEETEWTQEVRAFGVTLVRRLGIPLHFQDERLTSVRAERAIRSSGLPRGKREDRTRVDAAAAALILQLWLDRTPLDGGDR